MKRGAQSDFYRIACGKPVAAHSAGDNRFHHGGGAWFRRGGDQHPKPGEPAIYSRPEHPLTSDFAILALLPAMQPDKRILIFSGLTTFGTQAAVEYVCRPETAAELLKKITNSKGEIRPFEAVLETTINGGVPLETRLVDQSASTDARRPTPPFPPPRRGPF